MNILESVTRFRRLNPSIFLLAPVFVLQLAVGSASATTPADEAATGVAEAYLAALQTGDVDTIKGLMTGRYLDRRRRQLEMDGYSQRLAEMYGASSYEVLGANARGSQGASVDIALRFPDGTEARSRLLLEQVGVDDAETPIYRVVGEEEARD